MGRLLLEKKIMGANAILIFMSFTSLLILLAYFGGALLNLSNIGFEVIYPFITAIAVGEWGKTRSDTNFDIIAAQCNSLFKWVVTRFLTVFVIGSFFALISMGFAILIRNEISLWEMIMLYLPTAFFYQHFVLYAVFVFPVNILPRLYLVFFG